MVNILVQMSNNEIIDINNDYFILNDATIVSKNGYIQYIYSSMGNTRLFSASVPPIVDFEQGKFFYIDEKVEKLVS